MPKHDSFRFESMLQFVSCSACFEVSAKVCYNWKRCDKVNATLLPYTDLTLTYTPLSLLVQQLMENDGNGTNDFVVSTTWSLNVASIDSTTSRNAVPERIHLKLLLSCCTVYIVLAYIHSYPIYSPPDCRAFHLYSGRIEQRRMVQARIAK